MKVRTRIAPSPTGFPHIGTVYQALFNYAFAKRFGGQFLVRIEDTDMSRFVDGAEQKIYSALDWFGLVENESPRKGGPHAPYKQSERLSIYQDHAHKLVESGHAYYCTYKPEDLEKFRAEKRAQKLAPVINEILRTQHHARKDLTEGSYVIRMRIPDNEKIVIKDEIRGLISFDSNLIDDQVILKSDGFPTYHLAVVVDDHLMDITHVLRGEEWINSTPKHYLLYKYLGWEIPKFYHTSLLRNPDKSKMSKRHSHTNVDWYKEQGYLPDAIKNYLALMAWSHPDQREVFDIEEFTKVFDFADMKAVGPAFDLQKLDWMNGEYIRQFPISNFQISIEEYLKKYKHEQYKLIEPYREFFEKSIPLVQERMKKLSEYFGLCEFFFDAPASHEIDLKEFSDALKNTSEALENVADWTVPNIGDAMSKVCDTSGLKRGNYFMMMRVAITGKKISPPLNESMEILGKGECVRRIKRVMV